MDFDNLKSVQELSADPGVPEEKDTPASSPEAKTTTEESKNVREDAKTPEDSDDGFHKHSRFKELVEEKNEYKNKAQEMETKYQAIEAELNTLRSQIAETTGQNKKDIPTFETVDDLQNYLKELPNKIKQDIIKEFEVIQESNVEKEKAADDWLLSEIEDIKSKDPNLDSKELVKFALKYELTDIPKAYELFNQISQAKEEGKTSGEKIALRKASSGVKNSASRFDEPKFSFKPGRSLDDIIEEAKQQLKN